MISFAMQRASIQIFSLEGRHNRGQEGEHSDSGHMAGKRLRQSLTYILSGLIGFDSMVIVPHTCLQLQQPDPFPLKSWVPGDGISFNTDSILGTAARF